MSDPSPTPPASEETPGLVPGTLLVVDDDRLSRVILLRHLSPRGFATIEADSGPGAIEVLRENQVDLVLLDLMMPRMTGREVLRLLKADPPAEAYPRHHHHQH